MKSFVSLTIDQDIASVVLDTPDDKVNILNPEFLRELQQTADRLATEQGLRGVVVSSSKKGGFIAGADIHLIESVTDQQAGTELARQGQKVFARWAALPFPVIAAIHGHCMGGGTEFALACHLRIAAGDMKMALPEVRLGILPGFGGTQRLPRLIGLEAALDLILTGRTVKADKALRIGLIDAAAGEGENLVELARELLRDDARRSKLLKQRESRRKSLRSWLLEGNPLGRAILLHQAKNNVLKKTGGHYPAPLEIISLVRATWNKSLADGLSKEAKSLGKLIVTQESKNLVQVFFLSQRPKKLAASAGKTADIQQAAVLGAGVMGGGIAWQLAAKGIRVIMKDIAEPALESGLYHAKELFADKARGGQMELIRGSLDFQNFENVEVAIEAVVEKMSIKQQVLQETEKHVSDNTIIASNTSALSISELQEAANRPQRVAGLHFFNPVEKMPLVEVIRGEHTEDGVIEDLTALSLRLDKIPIVVRDSPGFLVNRLLGVYLGEACLLAEAGTSWHSLDQLAKKFGLPMGPFRLIDEVGIDIAAEVAQTLSAAFPYLEKSCLLEQMLAKDLKGKKSGAGFYRYREGHSQGPNPQGWPLHPEHPALAADLRRLLLMMVNEAGRCLDEKVVATAEDIDAGMVFGTGFPPFHGGLCRWADQQGFKKIRGELQELAKKFGPRFEPALYLREKDKFLLDRQQKTG